MVSISLCENRVAARSVLLAAAYCVAFLLPVFFTSLQAQGCRDRIRNNDFILRPALCANTVAFLEGFVPTGGEGVYTYQWQMADGNCGENSFKPIPGATGKDFAVPATNDPNACYRRVVKSGSCTDASDKIKVQRQQRTEPKPPTTKVVQPTCKDLKGSITVTSPAPAPGMYYSIDGTNYTNTTGVFTSLDPKQYRVSVKYPSGCNSPEKMETIRAEIPPTGTIAPATATLCAGSTIELSVSGGTSYQWYRNGVKIEGATAATYQATQTGEYTADILTASCEAKAQNSAVITESAPITFNVTSTDPDCSSPSGTITITDVNGGTGNGYTFSKDDGRTFQDKTEFANLAAGTYQLVVKDGAGCTSSPKAVVIKAATSTLNVTTSVAGISCGQNSGSVTVTATGGTPPYQYSVDGGPPQPGNILTGLTLGIHTVKVQDAAGCVVETSVTVVQINSTLKATVKVTDATCASKGSVRIEATGGLPVYSYSLDGGDFQASSVFDNLSAGTHKVTVKDIRGCIFELSFTVGQAADQPNLVITNPPAICADARASLQTPSIVAGSDNGLTYSYWSDANATTPIDGPSSVPAGTYYIKATNNNGCSTIKPVVINTISSAPVTITVAGPPLACIGRFITLTASEGNSYQWYRNDTALAGANERTYRATVGGLYAVAVNDGTCSVRSITTVRLQFQSCITTTETNVFVPTAFTPNNNGENDLLRPILYNITTLRYFRVFNRWGQMVFQTNEMGKGWDGTINGVRQSSDAFTWMLECVDNAGNIIKKSGRSLLIR